MKNVGIEGNLELITADDSDVLDITDPVMFNIRSLADGYQSIQRTRLAMLNRLTAYSQGRDPGTTESQSAPMLTIELLEQAEKLMAKEMNKAIKDHPVWPWLQQVRGVSGILACKLIGLIDIKRARHVSSLWKFCGLAVASDGQKDRLKKGEKAPYSTRAKTVCYLIGESFIRTNSPYRRIYDDAKVYYQANRPDWTPIHVHRAAMRKMEKIFLQHLWLVWREAEGLPTSEPYSHARLGHEQLYTPEEFVS